MVADLWDFSLPALLRKICCHLKIKFPSKICTSGFPYQAGRFYYVLTYHTWHNGLQPHSYCFFWIGHVHASRPQSPPLSTVLY